MKQVHKGYDFGGAESIIDPTLTIVDVQDIDSEALGEVRETFGHEGPIDLIKRDLRENFTDLQPVMYVYCGRMLRYLEHEGGWMLGMDVNPEVFQLFAQRLKKIVQMSGIVIFMDHLPLIEMVVNELTGYLPGGEDDQRWQQLGCEIITGSDPDDPTYMSEWRAVVQRMI